MCEKLDYGDERGTVEEATRFQLERSKKPAESRCNDVEKSNILAILSNKSFSWAKSYRILFKDRKKWHSVVASWGVAVDSNKKRQRYRKMSFVFR